MATKKTTTNKKEEAPKKTTAKKTTEKAETAKKTVEKTNKKEEAPKKTTAKKTTEKAETAKKTTAKKTVEKTNKKEEAPKKTTAKKTTEKAETIKKTALKKEVKETKEESVTANKTNDLKDTENIEKPTKENVEIRHLDSIIRKDADEKKDLKDIIADKKASDRKMVFKTSSPVRKIESIKTENNENKTERESITLLKEAIKAKSKNVSRPVSVKKRIAIVDDDNIDNLKSNNEELNISKPVISSVFAAHNIKDTAEDKKAEEKEDHINKNAEIVNDNSSSPYSFETFENNKTEEDKEIENKKDEINNEQNENTEIISEEKNEEINNEIKYTEEKSEELQEIIEEKTEIQTTEEKLEETTKIEEKATYSKSDIFKRPVIIPTDDEHIQKSKLNQEEIDNAIKDAPVIDENTSVENYKDYSSKTEKLEETLNEKIQELKEKDIKIIETEDELKTSSLPEIEKKPAEPYVVPAHSMNDNKKSNKIVPIVGIIIIILGLSFLGIQFFSGKNNEADDNFYEIVTNETVENDNILNTNNAASATNIKITNNLNIQSNVRPQTNNTAVNTQTNTTRPQTNNTAVNTQTNTTRPQTNNTAVNTQTNTTRPQTNNTAVNTQTNTTRPQTNNTAVNTQTNTTRPQTNNTTVNTQTNTTRPQTNNTTTPTPPKEPEITPPTPPTPPPNPPTANTNAAANNNTQQNNNTLAYNTDIYKTKWTDTLSSIATAELGDGRRWPSIVVLNENIINNPDNIVFNIDIKIPNGGKKKIEDMNDSEKRSLYNDYIKVSEMYLKIGKQNLANSIKSQADSILK